MPISYLQNQGSYDMQSEYISDYGLPSYFDKSKHVENVPVEKEPKIIQNKDVSQLAPETIKKIFDSVTIDGVQIPLDYIKPTPFYLKQFNSRYTSTTQNVNQRI